MRFRKYKKRIDSDIDYWGNYSEEINKYALFGDTISNIFEWYKEHPGEIGDISNQIVVVLESGMKIAVIVFNYFHNEEDKKVLGFNPIIVNPKYVNKGFGNKIIQKIIKDKKVLDIDPDALYACVDSNNVVSIKLFESNGFKISKKRTDNFFDYMYFFE